MSGSERVRGVPSFQLSSSGLSRGSRVQRFPHSGLFSLPVKLRPWELAESWILGINPRMTKGSASRARPRGFERVGRRGAHAPLSFVVVGACAPRQRPVHRPSGVGVLIPLPAGSGSPDDSPSPHPSVVTLVAWLLRVSRTHPQNLRRSRARPHGAGWEKDTRRGEGGD